LVNRQKEGSMTRLETWSGLVVAVCEPEGPQLAGTADINDFLSLAFEANADWLAVPVTRLGADFLRLRSRLAGEATQKFVTYRVGLAIIGDISAEAAGSGALADYVRECNRGRSVWFLPDLNALKMKLETGRNEA